MPGGVERGCAVQVLFTTSWELGAELVPVQVWLVLLVMLMIAAALAVTILFVQGLGFSRVKISH